MRDESLFSLFVFMLLLNCNVCRVTIIEEGSVLFRPLKQVDTYNLPLAKYPIISWMDIQYGVYPNSFPIKSEIKVGEPLTILIFISEINKVYDSIAKDCYAYDNDTMQSSEYVVHLKSDDFEKEEKHIDKWSKVKNINESITLLHTNLTAFKFPERNNVYLTCNIQLCYEKCKNLN